VRTAAKLEVLGIRAAANGEGHDVVKLQEAAFGAAST
jgi:hypothetical protein